MRKNPYLPEMASPSNMITKDRRSAEDEYNINTHNKENTNIHINYLYDQRVSYITDSIPNSHAFHHLVHNSCMDVQERETSQDKMIRKTSSKHNDKSLWRDREATESIFDRSKFHNNSFTDELNNSRVFKLGNTTLNMKEYWSPSSRNRLKTDYSSPSSKRELTISQNIEGCDMVRQEGSSKSQKGKMIKALTSRNTETSTSVHRFEFEEMSCRRISNNLNKSSSIISNKKQPIHPRSNELYAIGGSSEKDHMTIEKYDISSQSWSEVFKSNIALEGRSKFGSIMIDRKEIVVFGGKTSSKRFDDGFVFDIEKACIKETEFKLSEAKSGFGYCILNSRCRLPR